MFIASTIACARVHSWPSPLSQDVSVALFTRDCLSLYSFLFVVVLMGNVMGPEEGSSYQKKYFENHYSASLKVVQLESCMEMLINSAFMHHSFLFCFMSKIVV